MLKIKNKIALLLVLAFMTTLVLPVYAAEKSNEKQILTLEEIQQLALENSRTKARLELNDENVDRNLRIVDKAIDRINANFGSTSKMVQGVQSTQAGIAAQIAQLEEQILEEGISLEERQALETQKRNLELNLAVASKAAMDAAGSRGSLSSNKKQLKDQEDSLEETEEDMEKTLSDYEKDVKLTAALLAFKATELKETINVLQKNYDLKLRLRDLEKIKQELGLSLDTDINAKSVEASQVNKQLNALRKQYEVTLRNINDLMGRDIDAPLQIVKYNVPEVVTPAPSYESVIDEILENSYELYQLDRDIEDAEDDLDDTDGSHEEIIAENQVELKKLDREQKYITIQNNVKTKLASYDSSARAYREAIISFSNAEKNYTWAQKKFELGMISQLEMKGSEIAYLQAANDKITAAYDYYLAKNELECMKNDVSLDNYNALKGQMAF